MKYFFDTNTCICFLKGLYPALLSKVMSLNPDEIKIASMVKAELLYNAEISKKSKENLLAVKQFLLPFDVVPFDDNAATEYSQIRNALEKMGMVIGPNDLVISATVVTHNGILVTEKEFGRVPGLRTENWISA